MTQAIVINNIVRAHADTYAEAKALVGTRYSEYRGLERPKIISYCETPVGSVYDTTWREGGALPSERRIKELQAQGLETYWD